MSKQLDDFYQNEGYEDVRLEQNSPHRLEFITITSYLDKFVKPGIRVLDPCSGTGIYSFYLADRGVSVTAGDIVEFNVRMIEEKAAARRGILAQGAVDLESIYQGDILNLSAFPDESYDVVLCMGAFYHLTNPLDRLQAVSECCRVLKKGGIIFCTYINRMSVILQNTERDMGNLDEIIDFLKEGIQDIFYCSTPQEVERVMTAVGFEKVHHFGADGIGTFLHNTIDHLSAAGFEQYRVLHAATCEDESILGYSFHGVYVGRTG